MGFIFSVNKLADGANTPFQQDETSAETMSQVQPHTHKYPSPTDDTTGKQWSIHMQ